jgi:hypothetical protein
MKIYQLGFEDKGYVIIGKSLKDGKIEGVDKSVLEDICKEATDGEQAVFIPTSLVYDFLLKEGAAGRELLLNVVASIVSRGVLKPEDIEHYVSVEEGKRNTEFMGNLVKDACEDLGLIKKSKCPPRHVDSKVIDYTENSQD